MYTYTFSYIYVYKRNQMLKDPSEAESVQRQTLDPGIRWGNVMENFKIRSYIQLEFKIHK